MIRHEAKNEMVSDSLKVQKGLSKIGNASDRPIQKILDIFSGYSQPRGTAAATSFNHVD